MSNTVATGCIRTTRNTNRLGCVSALAAGAALAMVSTCALADGEFEGVFTQNEMCKGDGSKQEFAIVKVTAKDVSYSGGVCSIDSRQDTGSTIAMRLTCKFTSGAVMSSGVTFTKKDNNTFDMAQQEGTYKAVLHRCPQ
jgi:hypothetical protein